MLMVSRDVPAEAGQPEYVKPSGGSSRRAYNRLNFGWIKNLRKNWTFSLLALHVLSLACFPFVTFNWRMVALCVFLYYLRYFGMSGCYHRYFSHRAFATSRPFQFILGVIGCLMLQKGPLWWASLHRHHHKYSDQEEDMHSPQFYGVWWSHLGWFLTKNPRVREATKVGVPDFACYPELRMLDRQSHIPGLILAISLWVFGGFSVFYWGFILSQTLQFHGVFALNSWGHLWGSRRYRTNDTSRNSLGLAILTFGDGWHHNHHAFARSARAGFYWYEIDPTYYVLVVLETLGIIWDVRRPPLHIMESRLIKNNGGRDPYMENLYGREYSESLISSS